MGGDKGPSVIVEAMHQFFASHPHVQFLLHGPQGVLDPLVQKKGEGFLKALTIIHTNEVISSETKPSVALRQLPSSSMRLAIEAVRDKKAHGVLSSGNTGAYMALSKMILKTLPGISRPAIASQIPTQKKVSVLLDLGGNISCGPENLVDFAVMGQLFAQHVLNKLSPSVAILNVGNEEIKGHLDLQKAAEQLKKTSMNFCGFVEGSDIVKGNIDVIVTDGFTGNVALKTGEGVMGFFLETFRRFVRSSWRGKVLFFLARPFFEELKKNFDPRLYNGAIWLGLNGTAVKSHGGCDAFSFYQAIATTYQMIQQGVGEKITQELQRKLAPHNNTPSS